MPRRSKDQIAADCGLLPGEKPTPLQIRQSKEISRAREALASTYKPQPPNRPKVKVPQSKQPIVPSQSKQPVDATQTNQSLVTTKSKQALKAIGKSMNKENESEETEVKETTYNSPRFDNDDLDHLLGLMGMQENQDCLFGSGSITAVDGTTRAGCWETLATLMNVYHNNRHKKSSASASNRMKLNGPGMMKRWRTIKEKYVETKRYFDMCTGSGLLDQDYEKGIDTSEKKKEIMCPRYQSIHDIYGHKANITPHAILDTVQSKDLSIPTHHPIPENSVIDPNLDANFKTDSQGIDVAPQMYLKDQSQTSSEPHLNALMDSDSKEGNQLSSRGSDDGLETPLPDLEHNEEQANYFRFSTPDLPFAKSPSPDRPHPRSPTPDETQPESPNAETELQRTNENGVQSIRQATRTAKKLRRGAEPVANRPMKPLPAVDSNPGRRKAPISTLVKDRDEKRFEFFDRKTQEKKLNEEHQIQSQSNIATNALNWDKQKYHEARVDSQTADTKKIQLESKLADKNINWERERFNTENSRLVQAEAARVEQERIKTRREVMESCQVKGMSIQEIKEYMDLLFSK